MRSNLGRKKYSDLCRKCIPAFGRKYTLVCGENMAAKAGWCITGGGKPLKPILTPLNLEKKKLSGFGLETNFRGEDIVEP